MLESLCQQNFPAELMTFLVSMLPLVELRLGLPLGVCFGLPVHMAALIAFIGNVLVLIPLLYILPVIIRIMKSIHPKVDTFLTAFLHRTQNKHSKKFMTYGSIALMLIVALPLPGTGGWTGTLVSYLLGIPKHKSIPYITVGLAFASVIVAMLTSGVRAIV